MEAMRTPAETHIERLTAAGGGRLEIRLLPGNKDRLQELADAAGVSRERWLNNAIEKAWNRMQKKVLTT